MGFLDSIRDRLVGDRDDDYDDYDYDYDDYDDYDDDDYGESRSGLLGNTRRPEAESVSVYTRSGSPVSSGAGGQASASSASHGGGADERPSREGRRRSYDDYDDGRDTQRTFARTSEARPRRASALPAYVLRATSYDDVQMVVRRARTGQPVVLELSGAHDAAIRILDFCFGFATGINGEVKELGGAAFAVLPQGASLSETDMNTLYADGVIER